jgi:hypothetical protein
VLGVANVTMEADEDLAHALDSQSPLLIPVFVARPCRSCGAVAASSARSPARSWSSPPACRRSVGDPCGFALPLSIAMAYAVARFAGSRQNHVVGLVGILALQVVTLVRDASTGGLGALCLACPLAPCLRDRPGRAVPVREGRSSLQLRPSASTRERVER